MQITVNLPDLLVERVQEHWEDLSKKIINRLVLEAFLEGLINFDEFKEMLGLENDEDLQTFLAANIPQHPSGILNLYGTCPDLEFIEDDLEIDNSLDNDLVGVFDD